MLLVLASTEEGCTSLKYKHYHLHSLAWSAYWCIDFILFSSAGGPWLITDMRRGETIFELDHSFQEKLEQGKDAMKHSSSQCCMQWDKWLSHFCWMLIHFLKLPPHMVWVDDFEIQHLSSNFNQRVYSMFYRMVRISWLLKPLKFCCFSCYLLVPKVAF